MCNQRFLAFGGALIFVAPAPCGMRTVTRSFNSLLNGVSRHRFQIIGQSNFSHKINEHCRQICTVIAKLGSFVVPWECVMIVVPTFTKCKNGNRFVLTWIDVSVGKKQKKIRFND